MALFFRDHLQSEADTNDYNTSLRDCETKTVEEESLENAPLSQLADSGDYVTWKKMREKFLLFYSTLRFSTQDQPIAVGPSRPQPPPRIIAFDEPDSPRLETQNNVIVLDSEQQQHSPQEIIQIRIPTIHKTHHHAERISDIDLMAKSLTLMLCKAEKRFAVRQPPRVQFACNALSHPMYLHTSTPNWPRLTFGGFQEDGPLSSCYKAVVNFEMKQLQDDMSTLRQRAEFLEEDYVKAQRIHVFFYGKYAEALATIFLQQQTHHLYFSIQNVPHKCVFPYPASDWYEAHDMSECCLCIGDMNSKLKLADDPGNEVVNFGFDDPDMEIYVATGSRLEFIEHVSLLTPCLEHGVNVEPVRIEDSPFCDLAEQRPLKVVAQSNSTYLKLVSADSTTSPSMHSYNNMLTIVYFGSVHRAIWMPSTKAIKASMREIEVRNVCVM